MDTFINQNQINTHYNIPSKISIENNSFQYAQEQTPTNDDYDIPFLNRKSPGIRINVQMNKKSENNIQPQTSMNDKRIKIATTQNNSHRFYNNQNIINNIDGKNSPNKHSLPKTPFIQRIQ